MDIIINNTVCNLCKTYRELMDKGIKLKQLTMTRVTAYNIKPQLPMLAAITSKMHATSSVRSSIACRCQCLLICCVLAKPAVIYWCDNGNSFAFPVGLPPFHFLLCIKRGGCMQMSTTASTLPEDDIHATDDIGQQPFQFSVAGTESSIPTMCYDDKW